MSLILRSRTSTLTEWRFLALTVGLLAFLGNPSLTLASAAKTPQFNEYRVQTIYRGPVKAPDFGDPTQYTGTDLRCFGGDPTRYASLVPNFAGDFVIGYCTCGSGCYYLFLWNARTGKFYGRFPDRPIDVGPYGSGKLTPPVEYNGDEYHIDSSLLILEGCFEETCDCARRYYHWNGSHFELIFRESTRMPPGCTKK